MFYTALYSFWYLFFAAVLTYLVWGFIIGFEVVLAMSGAAWACNWLKTHHTYRQLYAETVVFYPMILLGYLFLELIPHYLFGATEMTRFDLQELFDHLYGEES